MLLAISVSGTVVSKERGCLCCLLFETSGGSYSWHYVC